MKRRVKRLFYNSTIFEDMGFAYYGPFDGHNIKELAVTLETAKLDPQAGAAPRAHL